MSMRGHIPERAMEELLSHVYETGVESFRDTLLRRCLSEFDTVVADSSAADSEGSILDDEALDMLAAAGDPASTGIADENLSEDDPRRHPLY